MRKRTRGAWILLSILVGPLATFAQTLPSTSEIANARVQDPPATVMVWNRPVVEIRATVGSQTPEQRARGIVGRIEALPHSELGNSVRAERAEVGGASGLMVFVGGRWLFGLVPQDLDPLSGETMEQVARTVETRLRTILDARAEARKLPVLLQGIGLTLAASIGFGLFVWGLVRIRLASLSRLQNLAQRREVRAFGVDVRPYAVGVLEGLARLTSLSVGLVAGYLWLTFVLGRFPYTQPWGRRLGRYLGALLGDLGIGAVQAIPGFFAVLVIFFMTRLVSRAAGGFFTAVEQGRVRVHWLQPETAKATNRLAIVAIWLFGITVAYPYIPGSETEAFKGVSVFTGLMISLGSAGLVNQVMSGLVVVYARALKPGDFVEAGDTVGIVSEVGLLSTKIVTPKREEVTIPNAVLVSGKVTNHTKLAGTDGAVVSTTVTIGYDAPWRQVHGLLLGAASRTPGVQSRPEPFVLQRALSDFYVEYELRMFVKRPEERLRVLSALHGEIQDAFNEARVQIMSPHFEAQPEAPVLAAAESEPSG